MLTADDVADVPVPTQKYSFGVVKAAQARGDLQVLGERGRRAVRVHLGRDVKAGLVALRTALERALQSWGAPKWPPIPPTLAPRRSRALRERAQRRSAPRSAPRGTSR